MRESIKVLESLIETYESMYEYSGGKPDCVMMEDMLKNIKAMKRTVKILKSECEYQDDQEAHSEATLGMEMGEDIPLRTWAAREGLDESYARQKARRGSLITAHKIGRDWFISELETNKDNRRKIND